jgi:hypothetical protein
MAPAWGIAWWSAVEGVHGNAASIDAIEEWVYCSRLLVLLGGPVLVLWVI